MVQEDTGDMRPWKREARTTFEVTFTHNLEWSCLDDLLRIQLVGIDDTGDVGLLGGLLTSGVVTYYIETKHLAVHLRCHSKENAKTKGKLLGFESSFC